MITLTAKTSFDKLLWGLVSPLFVIPFSFIALLFIPLFAFCLGPKGLGAYLIEILKFLLVPLACVFAVFWPGQEITLRIKKPSEKWGDEDEEK